MTSPDPFPGAPPPDALPVPPRPAPRRARRGGWAAAISRGWRALRRAALAPVWRLLRWLGLRALALILALVVLFGWFLNPPTTWTIMTEGTSVPRKWTRAADIAPVMLRSVVAAEDANFCLHWGFDMTEIRRVIARGERRGASTLTQ